MLELATRGPGVIMTLFQKFCRKGENADVLSNEGRFSEAHQAYAELLREIEVARLVDSYLVSKITLGLLMCHIKLGEYPRAFAIWNSSIEESLFGIGIYGLEHAQTSVHDMICYDFVCAFLHSLSAGDKTASSRAVNQYMSRICEHARDHEDDDLLRLAVSNWKQHLKEIYGSSLPHAAAAPLIEIERTLGETVRLQTIGFPAPSNWEKPEGFREMSQLIPFQPLEFKSGPKSVENGGAARKLHRK